MMVVAVYGLKCRLLIIALFYISFFLFFVLHTPQHRGVEYREMRMMKCSISYEYHRHTRTPKTHTDDDVSSFANTPDAHEKMPVMSFDVNEIELERLLSSSFAVVRS